MVEKLFSCLWKVKSKQYFCRNTKFQACEISAEKMCTLDENANQATVVKISLLRTYRTELKKVLDSQRFSACTYGTNCTSVKTASSNIKCRQINISNYLKCCFLYWHHASVYLQGNCSDDINQLELKKVIGKFVNLNARNAFPTYPEHNFPISA